MDMNIANTNPRQRFFIVPAFMQVASSLSLNPIAIRSPEPTKKPDLCSKARALMLLKEKCFFVCNA